MDMRLRVWLVCLAAFALGLVAVGCGGDDDQSTSNDAAPSQSASSAGGGSGELKVKPRTIGLVLTAGQSPISMANTRTIEAAADKLGWTINKTDAQGDPAAML